MTPQQIVQSGDVELAVYTWGTPGDKPTVVLVHGYPDCAAIWRATAARLAERYHVIAYDVRGAGRSSRPQAVADYDLQFLVNDLAAVLDATGPDQPVHLIGHDWGSIQCWEAVTTERLTGRIASFTSMSGPSLDHAGHWLRQRLRSGKPGQLGQVARQFAHSWYVGMFHLPALAPAVWKRGLGRRWPSLLEKIEGFRPEASATQIDDGRHGVKLYRANVAERVLRPRQRRTDLPIQLIVPTRDKFMVGEIWDDLLQWAPKVWRRDLAAGHWLQLSHSDQVADWATEFVDFIEGNTESAMLRQARLRPKLHGKS